MRHLRSFAVLAALLSSLACRGRDAAPAVTPPPVVAASFAPADAGAPPPRIVAPDPDRPPWADEADDRPLLDAEREFAATPAASANPAGWVVCRADVSTRHEWDPGVGAFFSVGIVNDAPPDLTLHLRVGAGVEHASEWTNNRHVGYGSFPATSVRSGDELTFRLEDRDVVVALGSQALTRNDPVGQATARWNGAWPVTFRAEFFTAECRLLPAEAALAHARPSLDRFDRAMTAFAPVRAESWVYPGERLAAVRSTLRASAAWLGWSHPEVRTRLGAHDAEQARLIAVLANNLRRERVTPTGVPERFADSTVTLAGWRCDAAFLRTLDARDPPPCAALVDVTVRPGAVALDGFRANVVLHVPFDRPVWLARCWMSVDSGATWGNRCVVEGGGRATIAYAPIEPVAAMRDPWTLPAVIEFKPFTATRSARFRASP